MMQAEMQLKSLAVNRPTSLQVESLPTLLSPVAAASCRMCCPQVIQIETALKSPAVNRPDLAALLRGVQEQERSKLKLTLSWWVPWGQ